MQSFKHAFIYHSNEEYVRCQQSHFSMISGTLNNSLLDMVEYLVDDRVGVIRNVNERPPSAGAPSFFYFYATACNTKAFCDQKNFGDTGGAAVDRARAASKAIGEGVERYCAAIYDRNEFTLSSYETAPFQCVHPSEFALFSTEQYAKSGFQFVPFDTKSIVRWAPALDAATNEIWHVPAAMVFVPYFYDLLSGEHPIVQPISTGLACHTSSTRSKIAALCEVIERDAFTITWQARIGPPMIRIESLSAQGRDLVQRFLDVGGTVTLFDITLGINVSTVLAVVSTNCHEAPALVFAASSHLDPEQAVKKSLEEAAHTRILAQHLKLQTAAPSTEEGFADVKDQDGHVRLYAEHRNGHFADFIFASNRQVDFDEMTNLATGDDEKDLEILISNCQRLNHRVLLADITTPDISDLGLYVTRAIVPGFHPLFMGHAIRALGGSRLWNIPQALGYHGITPLGGDNPAPHPYP